MYHERGYRYSELNTWVHRYTEKCWERRIIYQEEREEHISVLKTWFNPIWDSFPIRELWTTMRTEWCQAVELEYTSEVYVITDGETKLWPPFDGRLLVSRKRLRQLKDVFTTLRRTIHLEALEQDYAHMEDI